MNRLISHIFDYTVTMTIDKHPELMVGDLNGKVSSPSKKCLIGGHFQTKTNRDALRFLTSGPKKNIARSYRKRSRSKMHTQ